MDSILERIKVIMEKEGTSPSTLADQIGISRPLMSHVMSGRNKPSLQLVLKILEHFPSYSADWLLLGKDLPNSITIHDTPVASESKTVIPTQETVKNDDKIVRPNNSKPDDSEQVIVFYNDRTFSVYKPRQ